MKLAILVVLVAAAVAFPSEPEHVEAKPRLVKADPEHIDLPGLHLTVPAASLPVNGLDLIVHPITLDSCLLGTQCIGLNDCNGGCLDGTTCGCSPSGNGNCECI